MKKKRKSINRKRNNEMIKSNNYIKYKKSKHTK